MEGTYGTSKLDMKIFLHLYLQRRHMVYKWYINTVYIGQGKILYITHCLILIFNGRQQENVHRTIVKDLMNRNSSIRHKTNLGWPFEIGHKIDIESILIATFN